MNEIAGAVVATFPALNADKPGAPIEFWSAGAGRWALLETHGLVALGRIVSPPSAQTRPHRNANRPAASKSLSQLRQHDIGKCAADGLAATVFPCPSRYLVLGAEDRLYVFPAKVTSGFHQLTRTRNPRSRMDEIAHQPAVLGEAFCN